MANGERKAGWQGSKWIRPEKRQALYDRDDHKCIYCGGNGDDSKLTLDHLTPVELGGGNEAKNLVTCCLACNSSKQHKTVRQFLACLEAKGHDPIEIRKRIRKHIARKLKGYNERIKKGGK